MVNGTKNNLKQFISNEKNIYSIENEIYIPEEDNKQLIIKGNNNLIIPHQLSKNIDFIFNYIKIPMNVDSNIQIICNYLYLLEKNLIDKVNIFIFDISNYKQINLEVLKNTKVTPEYINYLKNKYIIHEKDNIKNKSQIRTKKEIKKNKNRGKIKIEEKNKKNANV